MIPGLATALPEVSDGGKTYTMTLRKGLKYSNGEPVVASDFTHSLERVFVLNSSGSPFYEDIVGAAQFMKTKKGGIPGVETDDKSGTITIHLTHPAAPSRTSWRCRSSPSSRRRRRGRPLRRTRRRPPAPT